MSERSTPAAPGSEVAIIGMAGRFPGAGTVDELWPNLRDGVTSIAELSDEQLLDAGVPAAELQDPSYVKVAARFDGADTFDAAFFGYSPREAGYIDPQQRVLLECAWEAMEDAGHSAREYPYPVGVFAGSSLNTYLLETGLMRRLAKDFVLTLSSSDKDFLATRIAYKLNLEGPAMTVQSACSTSLVAVHVAVQALLDGECDLALAGGVCVKVPQDAGYYWQQGGIVSRDGAVRSFDAAATGTVFGSGAGIVVLKRLDDALADGDCIRAVLKGSAVNNDGNAKASFTAPSVDKQAEVVVEALARAGVSPLHVGYLEAHGTGTPLGDPIEFAALCKAFRTGDTATGYCAIGSIKPNVGHLEAAAGIAGLIKAVLALEHQIIPPLTNFAAPNPACDFATSPFYPPTEPVAWPRESRPRRAGVSALGVGGTNAHIVLEEAPRVRPAPPSPGTQLLVWSARTPAALEATRARLADALSGPLAEASLADIAFTLQRGRIAFEHRGFVVVDSVSDAARQLRYEHHPAQPRRSRRPRATVCYLPARVELTADQHEQLKTQAHYRRAIDECSAVDADAGETFVTGYALARLWLQWLPTPAGVAGDGIGDLVARCIRGELSLTDASRRAAGGSADTSDGNARMLWQRARERGDDFAFVVVGAESGVAGLAGFDRDAEPGSEVVVVDSVPATESGRAVLDHLLTGLGTVWTAGGPVDWQHLHEAALRRRVRLPSYPFMRTRHWYVEPSADRIS